MADAKQAFAGFLISFIAHIGHSISVETYVVGQYERRSFWVEEATNSTGEYSICKCRKKDMRPLKAL